jgi:recombination protein RecT
VKNQVSTKELQGVRALINSDSYKQQFSMVLPKHVTPERFIRMANTAMLRNPEIEKCTPQSVVKCLLEIAAWGIEADGRRAHLIPFKNSVKLANGSWEKVLECTVLLDWKGLAELAQRSGQIAKLHADLICENDSFEYDLGEIGHHKIDFRFPRGKPYAAYARAVTKDGATYCAVMTEEEILSVRNRSQGWMAFEKGFAKQSPWDPSNPTSEGEMWKKTAFRRLSKWLPLSPEFRDAIEADDTDTLESRVTTGRVVETADAPKRVTVAPFTNPKAAQEEPAVVDLTDAPDLLDAESADISNLI